MNNDDNNKDGHGRHHRPWRHHGPDRKEMLERKMDLLDRMRFGRRGFLRPQIIELFEEQGAMNGVDIMSKLQEMSRGWYRPSPGAIYPLLEQLEKEGVIAKNKDDKYELTAAYAKQAGARDSVGRAVSTIESNVSYLEDLQKTDSAKVSKYKDKVEKLLKRLDALNGALQPRGES